MSTDPWGRVDDDGTVYVRTAEGERAVGSWKAGEPDEALAYFHRKYDELAGQVQLLEQRVKGTDLAPAQAEASIVKLREAVADAHAIGDLAALVARLDGLTEVVAQRREEVKVAREHARAEARTVKERIVAEAELIADSTDWGATAAAYRELMQRWKNAGRASREAEDDLWTRFKGAQDQFFQARSAVFAERDASLAANAELKEVLLTEAEKILPVTDVRGARAAMRHILERWEAAGPVPREQRDRLEGGLRKVDDAVRKAEDAEWKRSNPEARARAQSTVDQLRTTIDQLEKRLAKAQTAGRAKDVKEAEEAITARRSWLEEAERTLAEFS